MFAIVCILCHSLPTCLKQPLLLCKPPKNPSLSDRWLQQSGVDPGLAALHCNAAVVAMINKGNFKEQECMHLLRCLYFIGVEFNLTWLLLMLKAVRMFWLMRFPEIISLSSVNSTRRLRLPQPASHQNCWTFLSCPSPTGRQQPGQICGALFSPRSSRVL